jgi:hypothetical protein
MWFQRHTPAIQAEVEDQRYPYRGRMKVAKGMGNSV